jgi:hypothetical protein
VSGKAVGLVWEVPDLTVAQRLVMLRLADCADYEMGSAWPSVGRMARECGVDVRTVQRALRELEHRALISVQKAATQHRPTIWRLHLQGRQNVTPESRSGVTSGASGVTSTTSGVTPVPPDPSLDPSQDPPVRTPGNGHAIKALLAEHERLFTKAVGSKPHYTGKDAAHAKRLIAQHGYETVVAMLPRLFDSPDPFIRQSGKDMAILSSCWNKLASQKKPQTADDVRRHTETRNRAHVLNTEAPRILTEDE